MKKFIPYLLLVVCTSYSFGQVKKVEVRLHSIEGYGQHEDFAEQAINLMEKVMNSDEFRNSVIHGDFIRTNGFTNKQLFDKIILAQELEGPGGKDNVIDLRARVLRINSDESQWAGKCELDSRAGTVGIDGNGDGVTAICPQRLKKWSEESNVAELAGHYTHEFMHILGFGHYKFLSRDKWRQKTFVYKIGNLVRDLVDVEMNKQQSNSRTSN